MATLADLITYCQRHGWRDTTADGIEQLGVWINDTLQDLALMRKWPFYERAASLNLTAPYKTGTVTLTKGSAAVSADLSTMNIPDAAIGQEFYASDDGNHLYYVDDVDGDNLGLTLSANYLGTGGAGKTYAIQFVKYEAADDYGQEGPFYFEDGRELGTAGLTYANWEQARIQNRATASIPDDIVYRNGYFYVNPAPSAAAMVRYVYWAKPVLLEVDETETDWPASHMTILHTALRLRMSIDDSNAAMTQILEGELERRIDTAFNGNRPFGPIPVDIGSTPQSSKTTLGGLKSVFNITD
jgi:hypothetical protein